MGVGGWMDVSAHSSMWASFNAMNMSTGKREERWLLCRDNAHTKSWHMDFRMAYDQMQNAKQKISLSADTAYSA